MGKRVASKMRRNRRDSGEAAIRSRIPTAAEPASRVVRRGRDTGASAGFLDATQSTGPLSRADVVDRIVRGDSAQVLGRLPEASVACAITSPPYWNLVDYGYDGQIGFESYDTYRARLTEVWRGVARCLRPNGKLCINVPLMPVKKSVSAEHFEKTHTRMVLDLYADLKADVLAHTDLRFYSLYIWEKQTTEKMFGSYPFPPNLYERNTIEFIAVFVKPGAPPKLPRAVKEAARLTSEEWMDLTAQIWRMYPANVKRSTGHPAPFPEALPNRLIHMYTFPRVEAEGFAGDVVLDPLAGWGTTCVAARRAGRPTVGIDLSAGFCAEAAQRLADTPVEPAVALLRRA